MIGRMVPTFRLMQERIDGVNRVMREQLVGIRVVRAFVREPEETARFDVRQRASSPTRPSRPVASWRSCSRS